MANNLTSWIKVKANEDTIKYVDSLVTKAEERNENDPYRITSFAKAFYKNVAFGGNGGVLYDWAIDNIGPKWTYIEVVQDYGEFSITSASYPPKQFFIHLYKLCAELDENVEIEVKYEDETYNPIGAMVVKKDRDGTPCIWKEEHAIENPLYEMNWDDEGYDEVQQEFTDKIYETKQKLLKECHELVLTDGEPI
tara:strand:- start:2075 stop:2656 length:582 start_codon:yes stop_codon:yes gene_type:complete